MSDKSFAFEILCINTDDSMVILNEQDLIHSLMANGTLWKSRSQNNNTIVDEKANLKLSIRNVKIDPNLIDDIKSTYLIEVKANYSSLETFRYKLVDYINRQGFGKIYILTDEISSEIACKIYPKINKLENLLRKYVMMFFITKLGFKWWEKTADSKMSQKAKERESNEEKFAPKIDNKVYLIDFKDLGQLIHSQSSGFISREDVIKKVRSLEESVEAIKKLKEQLETNYTKFFKESFQRYQFQAKWQELEKIRNKVAHNNLFVQEDLDQVNKLADSLIEIIQKAIDSIEGFNLELTIDEKAAINEISIDNNIESETQWNLEGDKYKINDEYLKHKKVINEEELLQKLDEREQWAANRDGFVGVSNFVTKFLGNDGFDYKSTYNVIDLLVEKGLVEIYTHNSDSGYFPLKAIKRKRK
ncbi:hypothetical protein SR1949_38850 [Sphaerospermopsis reniformis]|uniref:Uncharacterized protein n=1 Tax=Sphaerospermopsis reniformis TaxID=531300 RepID=A0A480A4K9_9CYAN|nr:Swt1 family HEPN domain-containing protein [Sphaerospermopsis reniformis]GCL38766.1 hypothetical protein SR1949_38850 [Sphaerospermopsis reniformis]